MKTFIKWQGNKTQHINKFIKYFPKEYNTYIEPFIGSGAVLLKLEPKKWIINDLNKDLINIWNTVKNEPVEIIKTFKKFGKTFKNLSNEHKIIKCRKLTGKLDKMEFSDRAINYLLMSMCAYMGIIIKNKSFYF